MHLHAARLNFWNPLFFSTSQTQNLNAQSLTHLGLVLIDPVVAVAHDAND